MSKKKLLTKKGYDELLQELEEIKNKKLPDIIKQIKEAREAGDLSENAEYHSAKEEQALLQIRLSQLEDMLEGAEIVDASSNKDKIVKYGSKVLLKLDDGKEYEVIIVGSGEVKVGETNKISFDSPVGTAIEGKKENDLVKIKLPGGRTGKVKILKVN